MNAMIWYSRKWVNKRSKKAFLKRNLERYRFYFRNSWERYVNLHDKIEKRLDRPGLFGVPSIINRIVLDRYYCRVVWKENQVTDSKLIIVPVIKSIEELQ